jgi:hypothetical protein
VSAGQQTCVPAYIKKQRGDLCLKEENQMEGEAFVLAMKRVIRDATSHAMISRLQNPTGREPSARTLRLASWYAALDEGHREMVKETVRATAEVALFSLCAVLDRSRPFDMPPHGSLELYHVRDNQRHLVNDPTKQQLMDFVAD